MTDFDKRIGQRFVVGFHGLTAPDYILEWLSTGRIGGVILFSRNVESPAQLASLTRSLHEASETPILIGIDQEGGMVARLWQAQGFTESPGAMALAAAPDNGALTHRMSRILGDEMLAMGINWTYAPVVDLSYNAENPTVGTRSFGRDAQSVGELAAHATQGFQAGGVMACAKHFPGLGNTSTDSHLDLPALDTPLEQLISEDLLPYRHVVDADIASIMTTHTIFNALDTEHPATLSETIIQRLLREELNYDGLVVTDCLEMHAITKHYGEGESSVRGLLAGIDILLISHTRSHQEAAFEAVDKAVQAGRIPEANIASAYERIMRDKQQYPVNVEAINAEAVGTDEHIQASIEIAKACINLQGTLPTFADKRVGLVEFGAFMDSNVMDANGMDGLAPHLANKLDNLSIATVHAITPDSAQIEYAKQVAGDCDVLIIVTRNAHVHDAQGTLAGDLLNTAGETVLVILRNPYDADVLSADAVISTFSPSAPSLVAVTDALLGVYHPNGQRPVGAEA
ncbi:MAG: beta-N-acetylhexosaminidase [Chloroflexota bacterium]